MADVNYVQGIDAPVIGAQDGYPNPFVRVLNAVPRILSSKVHVVLLFLLGIYIVVLPLLGLNVSAKLDAVMAHHGIAEVQGPGPGAPGGSAGHQV